MSVLEELLAGGPDYRVTADIGGAIFAPRNETEDGLERFQKIVDVILAQDGLGYSVVNRLTHHSRDYAGDFIDRVVISIPEN